MSAVRANALRLARTPRGMAKACRRRVAVAWVVAISLVMGCFRCLFSVAHFNALSATGNFDCPRDIRALKTQSRKFAWTLPSYSFGMNSLGSESSLPPPLFAEDRSQTVDHDVNAEKVCTELAHQTPQGTWGPIIII